MKKTLIIILIGFIIGLPVSAHPGNTDSFGCHTCKTNCSSWGYYYGQYHCHNSRVTSQSSTSTTPTCPLGSRYDYLSKGCKCFLPGYVIDTDFMGNKKCISLSSKCTDLLGYGASYSSVSKKCECKYGYLLSGGKCITQNDYCHKVMGAMSKYNNLSKRCECSYGYLLSGGKCITQDDYCHKVMGMMSSYNYVFERCECYKGLVFNGSQCVLFIKN